MSDCIYNPDEWQERLSSFAKHRKGVEMAKLSKFYAIAGETKKAKRCEECGTFLAFNVYRHKETGEQKRTLDGANFCEVRWCPMCAWRKSRKLVGEFKSLLAQVEEQQPVKYLFLTLTVENPPLTELRATLKQMSNAFRNMTKTPEFRDVVGFIRTLEVLGGKTKRGLAHPHYHTLMVVKPEYFTKGHYVPQARWCEVWKRCLKVDYTPIADVRRIKPKREGWSAIESALFETLKYLAKPQEIKKLTPDEFIVFDQQTKGAQQYARGGVLKTLKPREREELDPAIWEKLEREFYQWVGGKYKET